MAVRRGSPSVEVSFFFQREALWRCGEEKKTLWPWEPVKELTNTHIHTHTHTHTHTAAAAAAASISPRKTQARTQTCTRLPAMRTVLHEHTHYISQEVRQKSKALTREVKGIQRRQAAERRGRGERAEDEG